MANGEQRGCVIVCASALTFLSLITFPLVRLLTCLVDFPSNSVGSTSGTWPVSPFTSFCLSANDVRKQERPTPKIQKAKSHAGAGEDRSLQNKMNPDRVLSRAFLMEKAACA
jgi:hypothetical protein